MTRSRLRASMLAVALSLAACTTTTRCPEPGVATSCVCPGGAPGARVCGDDHQWLSCHCEGAIGLPNAIVDRAVEGGTGGGSGGTGAPPTTGPIMSGDDDAGADPTRPDGGSPVVGGAGGAGGMTGGAGGAGGTGPDPLDAYRPCMQTSDCGPDAECVVTPGFVTASVCAPACIDVGDCPVPAGTYEATAVCDVGFCKLDCTPLPFAPLLTCPTGMVCIAPLFGISHCHDDGV